MNPHHASVRLSTVFLLPLLLLPCLAPPAQLIRPRSEQRTVSTDVYEMSILKNGTVSVRRPSGEICFQNAAPHVLLAGEEKPRGLDARSRDTTRLTVNDRLGQGQGMLFSGKNGDWVLATYPGKPFFTAKHTFRNNGKKPVRVARLSPWSAGVLHNGLLVMGAESSQTLLLDNGSLFRDFNDYPKVQSGGGRAQWNMAAFNPVSGRTLVAGFLTTNKAWPEFNLTRGDKAPLNAFDRFSAECVYDPPVEVAPGGTLESETLYISVGEDRPLVGLDRFGKAQAVVNGVRDARPFMPHGWDSWSTKYHHNINEAVILENLDAADRQLKRYGWTHFALDAGWERGLGDWEAHPERFPNGMKAMADEIHRRGMTASLWINPFAVSPNAPVAREHPEWLLRPAPGLGRMLVGGDKLLLDVTRPEVRDHVAGIARRITSEWGYDAIVEADFVYFLLAADTPLVPNLTNIEVLRMGMEALRSGMREGAFLMTMTPQPVNGCYAEGVRTGRDCAPVWRADNLQGSWGAVDALTNTIRRFYMSPHLFVPDQDCVFFAHEATRKRWNVLDKAPLTREQSIAWLTGAALTGGVVKIGDAFTDLAPEEVDLLRRILPVPPAPARPLDLFQGEPPRVWSLTMKSGAGEWTLLALFNWDTDAPATLGAPFSAMGLNAEAFHTVHDFWAGRYEGTAKGRIEAVVPPGSVRLFGIRRHEPNPQFIATDRHISMGASDHNSVVWDQASGILRGEFDAVADTPYVLTLSCPEPWQPESAEVTCGPATLENDGASARLRFNAPESGPASWSVQYRKEAG